MGHYLELKENKLATVKIFLINGPHPERERAPLVRTYGMLQRCSQDSL